MLILIAILFAGCVTVVPCPTVVQEDPWRWEVPEEATDCLIGDCLDFSLQSTEPDSTNQ